MNVIATALPGVLIIEPKVWGDDRGYFFETWHAERYGGCGLPRLVPQENLSMSRRGVLRGLHLQHPRAQGKLCQVFAGEVFDVAVDLRRGSPTFGRWLGVLLSAENKRQLWVPPGFAHGFLVTSESALFAYKCSDYYHPETELSVRWDDPRLAIDWPLAALAAPELSPKDQAAPLLSEIPAERLPAIEDYP